MTASALGKPKCFVCRFSSVFHKRPVRPMPLFHGSDTGDRPVRMTSVMADTCGERRKPVTSDTL